MDLISSNAMRSVRSTDRWQVLRLWVAGSLLAVCTWSVAYCCWMFLSLFLLWSDEAVWHLFHFTIGSIGFGIATARLDTVCFDHAWSGHFQIPDRVRRGLRVWLVGLTIATSLGLIGFAVIGSALGLRISDRTLFLVSTPAVISFNLLLGAFAAFGTEAVWWPQFRWSQVLPLYPRSRRPLFRSHPTGGWPMRDPEPLVLDIRQRMLNSMPIDGRLSDARAFGRCTGFRDSELIYRPWGLVLNLLGEELVSLVLVVSEASYYAKVDGVKGVQVTLVPPSGILCRFGAESTSRKVKDCLGEPSDRDVVMGDRVYTYFINRVRIDFYHDLKSDKLLHLGVERLDESEKGRTSG